MKEKILSIVPEAILEEKHGYGSLAFHVPLFMIWPFVCAMTRILRSIFWYV